MELGAPALVSPKFAQNLLSLSERLKHTLYDKNGHENISSHSNWNLFVVNFWTPHFNSDSYKKLVQIWSQVNLSGLQLWLRSHIESVINICEWQALAIDCRAEGRSESNSQSIRQRNPIDSDSLTNPVPDGRSQFCRFKIWRHIENWDIQNMDISKNLEFQLPVNPL